VQNSVAEKTAKYFSVESVGDDRIFVI